MYGYEVNFLSDCYIFKCNIDKVQKQVIDVNSENQIKHETTWQSQCILSSSDFNNNNLDLDNSTSAAS